LVQLVVDRQSFFELTPHFGRSQITGLARLAGRAVGVMVNDSRFCADAMTAHGALKVRRFVDLCDWLEWTKPLLRQQLGPRCYTFRP
jgi:acetyl-CoA carboxylase carboxyltransferase component